MNELVIQGSGGGGGGEKAHTPVEAPNTLQAYVKGSILDLIAYGPIKGLRDGLKSVYLDKTPVENADGTMNFTGIVLTTRLGYPDQEYIEGFPDVQSSYEINTEVKFANPVVRAISNVNSNYALVTVQVASLVKQESNGDQVGYFVAFSIDLQVNSGAWVVAASDTVQGKTLSPYPTTYKVTLPDGAQTYNIRVRRLAQESTVNTVQDAISWTVLTEVVDKKLSYPNMAIVGIEINSKLFGNQLPARSYDVLLSEIQIPSNYDPYTRVYTGLWDGTFKREWSDNPAWCFYDLATHPVIGAGLQDVDKWILYQIGQYCDELVEDGYGGMEPRFTCNTIFAGQEDAVTALNTFASCFRGMSYWGTNTMVPVADMPGSIKKIVAPGNVSNGEFDYDGTGLRERHSVAVVMWNDPDDEDKAVPEIYEDPDSIVLYGWRETRVTAVACNSRGQARRLAKWILYSERMETQTVSYKAAPDHADVRPGDYIELADPDYQGARMGGRLTASSLTKLTLDAVPSVVEQMTQQAWFVSVPMPNGVIERAEISSFNGNVVNLLGALSDTPIVGAMWVLSSLALVLPQFRIVSVKENGNLYDITATEYDPRKYDIVEKDLVLPERPTSLYPSGTIMPPLDLYFEAYTYFAGDNRHQGLVISWTPPKDVRVNEYILDVKSPADGGFRTVYNGAGVSFDLRDAMGGEWIIRVRSAASGVPGEWITRTVQIATLLLPVAPDSVKVTVSTFTITLTPFSAYPNLLWEFWRSDVPLAQGMIETNATKLPTGTYLVDTGLRSARTYFYYVRGTNQYGLSAWFSTQGTTIEDFQDIMDAVKEDIVNGDLYEILNEQITTVATTAANTAVEAALEGIQEQIDNIEDALVYKPDQAYTEGMFVRFGNNRLYQALVDVPVGASPPDPLYWKDVGTSLKEANAMVTQVQVNTSEITRIDGKVTAQSSMLSSLQAHYRDDDGFGELDGALDAYDSNARFVEQVKVLANADTALSQRITELSVNLGDTKADLTRLEQTVVTANEATATEITNLKTSVGNNTTAIQQEVTARTTAVNAVATDLTTLTTDYSGNKTTVQNQLTALSTATTANATSISSLSTTVGNNTAAIQTVATAQATLDGKVTASLAFKLQLTVDGRMYAAGMGLDITSSGGVTQSQILFQADRIAMINTDSGNVSLPFLMEAGTAFFNNAMFKNASIDFLKISDTLQSNDYSLANRTGWRFGKADGLRIFGTGANGSSELNGAEFLMRDTNGTLRIKMSVK